MKKVEDESPRAEESSSLSRTGTATRSPHPNLRTLIPILILFFISTVHQLTGLSRTTPSISLTTSTQHRSWEILRNPVPAPTIV